MPCRRKKVDALLALLSLCDGIGIHLLSVDSLNKRPVMLWCFLCGYPEQAIELPMIWDAMPPTWRHCDALVYVIRCVFYGLSDVFALGGAKMSHNMPLGCSYAGVKCGDEKRDADHTGCRKIVEIPHTYWRHHSKNTFWISQHLFK